MRFTSGLREIASSGSSSNNQNCNFSKFLFGFLGFFFSFLANFLQTREGRIGTDRIVLSCTVECCVLSWKLPTPGLYFSTW